MAIILYGSSNLSTYSRVLTIIDSMIKIIIIWMKITKKTIVFNTKNKIICLVAGLVFALEFLFLFLALDFTSVSRNSIIYYSLPLWLTIFLFFTINKENLSFIKLFGLILAFSGVVISVYNNDTGLIINSSSLFGDFLAFLACLLYTSPSPRD